MANRLFCGDNLDVLREHVAAGSVDLVYLDPPFNSNADYAIDVKPAEGRGAGARIAAFRDSWRWGPAAADAYQAVLRSGRTEAAALLAAMRAFLGESATMAYLATIAVRLIAVHRALAPSGSLYLHCDPTAGHYLKLLLDGLFGPAGYRNEIVWLYTGPGSPGVRRFLRKHDTIFWYTKGPRWTFNADAVRIPHAEKTRANYRGGLAGSGFTGAEPAIHRLGKVPEDWWQFAIAARGKENVGYPTQKPLKLLERIILASSNPGEVVLDPFCGGGTALHAAEKHGRRWLGIDSAEVAVALAARRLEAAFPGARFEVHGRPAPAAAAVRQGGAT
jgi:DNA modification methylase